MLPLRFRLDGCCLNEHFLAILADQLWPSTQWPKDKYEAAKGEKVWERLQNEKTQNHLGDCNIQFSHACRPRTRSSRQRPCDLKTWCKAGSGRRIQQSLLQIDAVLWEGVMFCHDSLKIHQIFVIGKIRKQNQPQSTVDQSTAVSMNAPGRVAFGFRRRRDRWRDRLCFDLCQG